MVAALLVRSQMRRGRDHLHKSAEAERSEAEGRGWECSGGKAATPDRGYTSQVIGGSGVYEQKVPVLSAVWKCRHSGRCAFWMLARLVRRHFVTALRLLIGIRTFAGAPAQPIGGGELGGEEVDLRPRGGGACGIIEAFGFVEDRL